ncbi:MAG TPA: hypothetical protein V6C95_11495 [Coleofasciculaceae cyanobacterium]
MALIPPAVTPTTWVAQGIACFMPDITLLLMRSRWTGRLSYGGSN